MVTPVISDKPITTGSDRTTESRQGISNEPSANRPMARASLDTGGTETKPDVDNARQLYQLENNPLGRARSNVETPEQARTLLDQILQQFSTNPEAALKTQAGASNNLLGNLLSTAPG